MPFKKRMKSAGTKQAAMARPNAGAKAPSACSKAGTSTRLSAAKKSQPQGKKPQGKRTSPTFSSLLSRQRVLEQAKRSVWANLAAINDAIINLAKSGNYLAAKALFDMAGVYSLPEVEGAEGGVVAAAAPVASPRPSQDSAEPEVDALSEPAQRVKTFMKAIGVEPAADEPDPDVAA